MCQVIGEKQCLGEYAEHEKLKSCKMYLGIDLGTSGVKVLLIDERQNVISAASASLQVNHPHEGWSEQNPQDWINATRSAIAKLASNTAINLGLVRGIGLS